MTKRTVKFDISVSGSAVVDIDHLLSVLKSVQNAWARYLLEVYHSEGADALAATYVRQAYSGGLNTQLRAWAGSSAPDIEHGGKAKFAPAQCVTGIKPKPTLYPKDVPLGVRYTFVTPEWYHEREIYFERTGPSSSKSLKDGYEFEWRGHEQYPVVLV